MLQKQEYSLVLDSEGNKLDIEIDKAIITKMETALKRDFRGYLLTGIIDYINMKAKQYSLEVFGTDKISFELNGNNISIDNVEIVIESGVISNTMDATSVGTTIAEQIMKIARQSGNISVSRR